MSGVASFVLLLVLVAGSDIACRRIDRKLGTCSWTVGWYAVVGFLLLVQAVANTSTGTGWVDYLHASLEFVGAAWCAYCAVSTERRHRIRQLADRVAGGAR